MGDLLTLAKRMEDKADEVAEVGNQAAIAAAGAMLDYLVDETPVDTSQALSNWQIGLGRPVGSELPPLVIGKGGSSASASRAAAKAIGHAVLRTKKPGQPIYLSNLLPYIRRLNAGSSVQAPAGFVDAAIMVGRKFIGSVQFVRMRK